jgi:hypothetical protein
MNDVLYESGAADDRHRRPEHSYESVELPDSQGKTLGEHHFIEFYRRVLPCDAGNSTACYAHRGYALFEVILTSDF